MQIPARTSPSISERYRLIVCKVRQKIAFWGEAARIIGAGRLLMNSIAVNSLKSTSVLELYRGKRNVALIGRGASIPTSEFLNKIEIDLAICLNFVSLDGLPPRLLEAISAQQCQPPPPLARYSFKTLRSLGIKSIISNKRKSSRKFKRFLRFYSRAGIDVYHHPEDHELTVRGTDYFAVAPTQTGTALKCLFNVESVENIYLFGIDFFTTGYRLGSRHNIVRAPEMPNQNIQKEKGEPLIRFIIEQMNLIRSERPLTLFVSRKLSSKFQNVEGIEYFYDE